MEKITKIRIDDYFEKNGSLILERKDVNLLLRLSMVVNDILEWINEHENRGERDPK